MGNSERESEEELTNYYAENTVFVAVGKHLKESESIVSWVARKFGGKKRVCILHVHQPAQLLSFFDGNFTASKFKQRAIKALHESEFQKLHKLISQYVLSFSKLGVHADRMWIEMDSVEEGIVKMIGQHGIKWLVMGAAADKHHKNGMAELKSRKAIFVCEQAPVSCHIWFTCRGNLIYTRKGPGVDDFPATETPQANVETNIPEHVHIEDPGGYDSPIQQSLDSILLAEAAACMRVDLDEDTLSLDTDVSTEEAESESPVSNLTIEKLEHIEDHNDLDAELLDLNVVAEKPGQNDELGSPPRLTYRERGTILRACSVDFDSRAETVLELSSPGDTGTLLDKLSTKEEECDFEGKQHHCEGRQRMFKFRSSFDSVELKDKMGGKSRLQTPRHIYDRLERAISDAENAKQVAFQESVKRWKAEEVAWDAMRKADGAESECAEEMKQRKQVEEALAQQKLNCRKFKKEYETLRRELPILKADCSAVEGQIRESETAAKELEEKIISAVELLISFRDKRNQIEVERDKAIQEVENLRRLKKQRALAWSGPQFSTFSLIEIGEATCSFDPSKRIGDGTNGSIYQGILRHMDVAIRMLPNDGFQGQWMFEHEVEILSRVRHPNIVTLIGICPEARSVIYEYLERGNLEDNLSCRGKSLPMQWQTRVRIATELCSALVFLHTSNPPIFHGNLKPTKILLDANFVSKIGDLGIVGLIPQNQHPASKKLSYRNTSQLHTSVYIDPEYLETGMLSVESDVYSFGIVLLQLLTGKTAVKDIKQALLKDELELVLDFSAGSWPIDLAKLLARLALQCCERRRSKRPHLASDVWSVLEPLSKSCSTQGSSLQKQENRRPPSHFLCPIYQEIMKDPYTAADGYTYEGDAIRGWLDSGHKTSPMTNLKLTTCDLIPNHALQYAIQEWLQQS